MGSPARSQSFFPSLKDHPAPSRSLSSSIWAPQPQPNETTWPRAIASFSRAADDDKGRTRVDPLRPSPFQKQPSSEDVFGPVGFLGNAHKRDVGAIGDGRKKSSPDMETVHVEQLLRALDLTSPGPYGPPPLSMIPNVAPDLSPSPNSPVSFSLLTPVDSPARGPDLKLNTSYDFHPSAPSPQGLMLQPSISYRHNDVHAVQASQFPATQHQSYHQVPEAFSFLEPFSEGPTPAPGLAPQTAHAGNFSDGRGFLEQAWRPERIQTSSEWLRTDDRLTDHSSGLVADEPATSPAFQSTFPTLPQGGITQAPANEPINFLSLLHPSSSPPYHLFVARIIKSSDQQASIFLQQKLKVADTEERCKIIDAICAKGFEMMAHRFGNWAVQRCLEAASTLEERRKIVQCMRGRIVELASNCYGCHVLQKALDCEEEVRLLIVSELLVGDPAQTLVNKHASHVWSKIMELTWTAPAPPIFAYVNKSLKGKWASLACHETGSLVVQHAFENLEESAKDGIVDELLNQGAGVFGEVARNQWGSYCIQHILEHGSAKHREMALEHIVAGLLEFATNEQGSKSVTKALKEGGKDTLDRIVKRMAESTKGGRRAIVVDLALSVTGSQLIAAVLPNVDKDQRTILYESIRGHIVTLRGCKTGSKVIWLFDRMRAYYGY
ncbi:ARM repeat-containing protein [Artomyces pyxidatus]|uniref:ARM repeat-containing protein n=1 Tax=Artomyces pyxidatus TaxID=48021 RepID=A0ACB8TC66_9AGAM|nr:ARM repeat-containing protein [Artomyces pyxidatus]